MPRDAPRVPEIYPEDECAIQVVWPAREDRRWVGTPEFMAREQLEHSRHVGAQIEATHSLASFGTGTAIAALAERLSDARTFHRVRAAAASALGELISPADDFAALHALARYVRRQHCDGTGLLLPLQFVPLDAADEDELAGRLGHYLTLRAVVEAIGRARDGQGHTPAAALSLLHELLDDSSNAANPCDEGFLLGSLVEAVGAARPRGGGAAAAGADADGGRAGEAGEAGDGDAAQSVGRHVAAVTAHVRRLLALDVIRPSHGRVLTCSCLRALVQLETAWALPPSWALYLGYDADVDAPPSVRLEAARCLLSLALEPTLRAPSAGEASRPAGAPRPGDPALALALQLDEARAHAPLERLGLWRALCSLLEAAEEAEAAEALAARARVEADGESVAAAAASSPGALACERAAFATPGDSAAAASCQLLWQLMTAGSEAREGPHPSRPPLTRLSPNLRRPRRPERGRSASGAGRAVAARPLPRVAASLWCRRPGLPRRAHSGHRPSRGPSRVRAALPRAQEGGAQEGGAHRRRTRTDAQGKECPEARHHSHGTHCPRPAQHGAAY